MAAMSRAKAWLFDTMAHDQAEQLRIKREVQRKKMDLDQIDLPYPGSMNNNTIHYVESHAPPPPPAPPRASTPDRPDDCRPAPVPAPVLYQDVHEIQNTDGTWSTISRGPPAPLHTILCRLGILT